MQPIFTLNARGDIMLEVIRDYFKLTNSRLRAEIHGMHQATREVLAAKGIIYSDLRAALVPIADRHEAGFIFDRSSIKSSWYGREVMQKVLPLLDPRTTQSVLCGDLLGDDQHLVFEILDESMVLSRSFEFRNSALLFCVYINNLSESALRRLHEQLAAFPAYLGFIPATFESRAKTYLSTTLVNVFLKNGRRVIMGHEDDRPNDENVNMVGYAFEEFGYQVFSLQSMYFGVFLSFKIERAVYKGFEVDTEMAITTISDDVLPLQEFTLVLEEAKYDYLLTEKLGSLRKAGIADLDRERVASLIKSKIAANYIYHLIYLQEHDVSKFNVMIEVDRKDGGYPTRMVAALEYRPEQRVVRLITLH